MERVPPQQAKSSSSERQEEEDVTSRFVEDGGTGNYQQSSYWNSPGAVSSAPATLPCGNYETMNVVAPWPSGVGVHPSSIASAAQYSMPTPSSCQGFAAGEDRLQAGNAGHVTEATVDRIAPTSFDERRAFMSAMSQRTFSLSCAIETSKVELEGFRAVGVPDSSSIVSYQPPLNVPPHEQLQSQPSYDHTPRDPSGPASADPAGSTDVDASASPGRRRRRPQAAEEKHCNCRRTNCLKMYCECFSHEQYCAETCACKACYNSTDYEDSVEEAKEVIVCRNPVAFSPKVISHDPLIRNNNQSIARHRSGCNCMKSHCVKGYCQCYQAGVGCSLACRCGECRNTYGRNTYGRSDQNNKTKHGYSAGGGSGRASLCSLPPGAPSQRSDAPVLSSSSDSSNPLAGQHSSAKARLMEGFTAVSGVNPSDHPFRSLGGANANAHASSETRIDTIFREAAIRGGGEHALAAPVAAPLDKLSESEFASEPAPGGGGLNGSAHNDDHDTPESFMEDCTPANTEAADANQSKSWWP